MNSLILLSIALAVILGLAAFLFFYLVKFVDKDEELVIEGLTEQTIIHGPKAAVLPMLRKSIEVRKAVSLGAMDYCVIKNNLTGAKRVEVGPKLVFRKPYDEILKNKFGLEKRKATSLKSNEYARLVDEQTGEVRVVRGKHGCLVPGPYEKYMDGDKMQAVDLRVFEYVKIQDRETGTIRTERGEQLVFLGPFEVLMESKKVAIEVDESTAVLVRNKRSGQLSLVTEKILFVPSNDEEVLEVRQLIKLADYEACIVRDKTGKDIFYFGTNEAQRSFFLPPHSELVALRWSQGRRRERRDLKITKLDLRPMYMSFEFNCRTNDNVELVLEGSFFWEITDLQAMVKFTNDTTGDICNHARSRFIELVSKVTLQEFMLQFNKIAEGVHQNDNSNFYDQRGVKIHSLEVTGYRCAESSTALILEEIIQETTNRMNRLQQQESENEIQLKQIRGDIEEEKARAELLQIQTDNSNARSKMEGLAEAERVKSFLVDLSNTFPTMDEATKIGMWNTLRKEDALKAISNGNAKLFFTPKDANLSIECHDHSSDWEVTKR
ncbi:unnamed protein product [Cylindrotheca closterium]|uniref:Band 7 domain-containing protein n=1 Tax=Cylindrotheca closterium TaxID=2856 RepID=A0AAD2CJS3_9STRA|nr:unnamed protein product [Cylindrotheca closterium]